MADYTSKNIQRSLKLAKALCLHVAHGATVAELAKSINDSSSNVLRALANLEEQGFAERHPANASRWRAGKIFIQISNTARLELEKAAQQLNQDRQNFQTLG